MSEFRGKRITKRYTMEIGAKPTVVFPLLCPEREKEWIDGWTYEMIYSQSGFAEPGCTFKTDLQPEGEAYWIMTRHVPPHEGKYVRFVVGLMFVTLSFKLAERDGATAMHVVYTYTGVTEKGNEFVAKQANNAWQEIFSAAGFYDYDQWKWHHEFEMTSSEQHRLFLESAGAPAEKSRRNIKLGAK